MDVIERLEHFSVDGSPDLGELTTRAAARRRRRRGVQAFALVALVGATSGSVMMAARPGIVAPVVGGSPTAVHSDVPVLPLVDVPDTPVPGEVARLTIEAVSEAIPANLPIVTDTNRRVQWLRLDLAGPALDEVGVHTLRGHRTTYGAALYHLDRVQIGHRIRIDAGGNSDTYVVRDVRVIPPDSSPASAVSEPGADAWLVIAANHPRFTEDNQLVVVARRQ